MGLTAELPSRRNHLRVWWTVLDGSRTGGRQTVFPEKLLALQVAEDRSTRNSRANVDHPKSGAPSGSPVELS